MTAQTGIQRDPFLAHLVSALGAVPGIEAIALSGSRARGTSHESSDYDIGLYFSEACRLDTDRLQEAAKQLADDPDATTVTPVGEWGPWIVGGARLKVEGEKRSTFATEISTRSGGPWTRAGRAGSPWTTSPDTPTDSARPSGWARSRIASPCSIRVRRFRS